MNEYWKDPRIDDEGNYDYLVEELPSDTQKWQWYYQRCDSMSYTECWRCKLKCKIHGIKAKIKKKIKQRKTYNDWMKLYKAENIPMTKEVKEAIKRLSR